MAHTAPLALVHYPVVQLVLDLRQLLAQQILEIREGVHCDSLSPRSSSLICSSLAAVVGPVHLPLEHLDLQLELIALLA